MDPAEQSLLQVLESSPEDWSIRLLIAEKFQQRGAVEEAIALIETAPVAPQTTQQLQQAVEYAGARVLGHVKFYVAQNPADGYGHQVLGYLLEHQGDTEQASKHYGAARALGFSDGSVPDPVPEFDSQASHLEEQVGFQAAASPAPLSSPPLQSPSLQSPSLQSPPNYPQEQVRRKKPSGASPKRTGSKLTAILVAIGVHVIIGIVAAILVILPPSKDEPEIVAAIIGPPASQREMQKKNVVKQVKKSTSASAAAAPVARLMRANAMAKFALPKVTKTSTGPLGMGEGNLGSGGFGGTGSGLGSGASFFGGSSTGERFTFILDWSGSMKPNQVNLVIKEMDRTLKSLKPGVSFQVILFAGGGYYAQNGWKVARAGGKNNTVTSPKGKKYDFRSVKDSYSNYDFRGSDSQLPVEEWQQVSPKAINEVMAILKKKTLFGGTDWRWPFKMAMNLTPAPDVIFFMADGTGGAHPPEILSYAKRKNPAVQINMFAMETVAGAAEMAKIAKDTKGSHKIILRTGKTIDGQIAIKNRKEAEKRIKAGR